MDYTFSITSLAKYLLFLLTRVFYHPENMFIRKSIRDFHLIEHFLKSLNTRSLFLKKFILKFVSKQIFRESALIFSRSTSKYGDVSTRRIFQLENIFKFSTIHKLIFGFHFFFSKNTFLVCKNPPP